MDAESRRENILKQLKESSSPIVARTLAKEFDVSRQVIVGDIALLRATGEDILSTPKGYVMKESSGSRFKKKIVCQHDPEETRDELYSIVDLGGEVIDVFVEHPIYGEINGTLNITSRKEVDDFIEQVTRHKTALLSELTEGLHIHTIAVKDKETAEKIEERLLEKGYLYRN